MQRKDQHKEHTKRFLGKQSLQQVSLANMDVSITDMQRNSS
jgi:hypothetical protein